MEDISKNSIIGNNAVLQKIHELRLERKYSQEYVAGQLGISQNAYSKLERGDTNLSLNRLGEIANIFNVKPEDILRAAAMRPGS